jgi:hypothetical protein
MSDLTNKRNTMTETDAEILYNQQLGEWPEFSMRVNQLTSMRVKSFTIANGVSVSAQFNPARAVSSGACVDAKSIAHRECFLCEKNRPDIQRYLPIDNDFRLLVNPYPILNWHFTIACNKHCKQEIFPYIGNMVDYAALLPHYTLLYNGPQCGASAPDHLHFQAVKRGQMPFELEYKNVKNIVLSENADGKIFQLKDFGRKCIVAESIRRDMIISFFHQIYHQLSVGNGGEEPLMNLFLFYGDNGYHLFFFLRKAHRPSQYYAQNDDFWMISPGAIDMGGVLVLPRETDFDRIEKNIICDVYNQVSR